MAAKLNLLEQFPEITLITTDDREIRLPAELEHDYLILLFYRGHW